MLMPKRTKYRRPHRQSYEGYAKGGKVDQMQCSPRKQMAMKGQD